MAWPLLVLAVALGFGLSAVFMRVSGLAIPAIIIGANGLVLAFCNITGLWGAWAILWPIEPLAVGLGLLMVGISNRSKGASTAAMILIGIAGLGFFLTSFFSLFNETILRFAVPGMLVLTGILLVGMHFLRSDTKEYRMKTLLLPLLTITALFLNACGMNMIVGSGKLINETRKVKDFEQIVLSVPARLVLTQNETESLEISAEDNLLPYIHTKVENGISSIWSLSSQASGRQKRS